MPAATSEIRRASLRGAHHGRYKPGRYGPSPYNAPMRALGIDFGEKRIGLAISDPDGRVAVPLLTFERRDDPRAARRIAAIARDEAVAMLVMGEPRTLAGQRGEAAERVARFGKRLTDATGLPLLWVEEALTSHEARDRLRRSGVDLAKHPERLDSAVAQMLLQEALDRRRP